MDGETQTQGNQGEVSGDGIASQAAVPAQQDNSDHDFSVPRLERERDKGVKEFVEASGFDSRDSLLARLAKATELENRLREFEQAQMTEEEKRTQREQARSAEIETLRSERDALKQQIEESKQAAINSKRDTVILNEFQQSPYASDILRLIRDEYSDDYAGLLGDDGTINNDIKEKLVKAVSEKRGEWLRVSTSPGSPSSVNRGYSAQTLRATEEQIRERASRANV